MGKAKRNKVKAKAKNPTGLPSVRDIEREESELDGDGVSNHMSKQESTIQTLLEMLQSPNAEDKILGLQTLGTIFEARGSVEDVMKHRVVKVAAPLLFDKNTAVMNAAAGALRNLSACGSHEICDLLVEQDIMTPLTALIQKYASEWQPARRKSENNMLDEVCDTFIQAVHLLWNVCESSSIAVKYFNDGNLLPVLAKCLEVDAFGESAAIAVAQCLHTVTEDNPVAVGKLKGCSNSLHKLLELKGSEPGVLLLRTLASGLLLNLSYGKVSSLSPAVLTQLLCNLSTTLSVDHRKALNDFTSKLPLDEAIETSSQHEKVLQAVTDIQYFLEAQQTSIELLANLCTSDETDDDAMEQDSSGNSSDDVLSDAGLPEDDGISAMEKLPLSVPSEIHEAIISGQLVQRIWEKSQLPADNVCQILREHADGRHVYNKLSTLRCRALLCLNNLISGLDIQDLGGPNNLYEMWLNIGNLIFKNADVSDTRFLDAATTALRASLQKLAEVQCNLFGQLTESDLQLMFNIEQQSADENVRANLIRSVGMLGMILISSPEAVNHTLLQMIGKFLLDVCSRESELWVVAETVDTLMDVFGEDETDLAAAQINLVEKLKALLPALRHKVRLQRKSLGDHYLLVTTVNTNLGRFIKYKSKRVSLIVQSNDNGT